MILSRFAIQPMVLSQRSGVASGVPSFGEATKIARPSWNRLALGPKSEARSTIVRNTSPPRECVMTSQRCFVSGSDDSKASTFSCGDLLTLKWLKA